MSVSENQLRDFVAIFTRTFVSLANLMNKEIREQIFPKFLLSPYKIIGTVSPIHGVGIEFVEESTDYYLKTTVVNEPIEDAMLPQKTPKMPMLEIGESRFVDIVGGVFLSREFHEKYVKKVEGTVLTYRAPLDGFLHVSVGGDVKLRNNQFCAILNGKPIVRKIGDCLWIFGSNLKEDFTVENARIKAYEEFDVYMKTAIYHAYGIGIKDKRREIIDRVSKKISRLQDLTRKPKLKEKELQSFFEENPEFLYFGTRYKRVLPQTLLRRENRSDLKPDFLLERTTDGFCDILDIKLPKKAILVGAKERCHFASDVEAAIAQVYQYREYFEDPQNVRKIEEKYGIKAYKPNILVLIGSGENLDIKDLIRVRDRQKYGEVITYQNLISHMKYLIDLLKAAK